MGTGDGFKFSSEIQYAFPDLPPLFQGKPEDSQQHHIIDTETIRTIISPGGLITLDFFKTKIGIPSSNLILSSDNIKSLSATIRIPLFRS